MGRENFFVKTEESLNSESHIKKTGLEISTQNYERAAKTLGIIVEQISELSIPEKIIQDWKILFASIRIVDHKIDHIVEIEKRQRFIQEISSFLKRNVVDFSNDKDLERAMSNIEILSANLKDGQKEIFYDLLLDILKITEKIKVEEDPEKLVDLTRLEGQITSRIFILFLPEEFKLSNKYNKLIHALTRLGRVGNSFDSFVDLPLDYANKQIRVRPNVLNRMLFFGAVLSDGLSIIKDTGLFRDLIKDFFMEVKATIKGNSEK
ncbi:hypothetical protein A3B84_00775 [Candidatus Nomurabacteria bacterium RIFCSPHIGHO2_02_FULL_35_13]|uniref:Uncharacterized protein n=1 Tax=Candidatus Nomurabacteria bacterium RIFCSPHIGHO2_02_FULL_35_13 TaxID=1801748 RepID=A0A1F6VNW7_9BACT|nr:MAG: hypothetical protein A3B84_00775 [Candidatus Nomurabacteria bacterium RIFCSPHIGHO2_02_FULL_35_13]